MLKILKKWSVKILSDTHNAIVSIVVVTIGLALGGIVAIYKNLRLFLFEILQRPIPLWLTILLVLLGGLLTYRLFVHKTQSLSSSLRSKIYYFDIEKLRWKTTIYEDGQYIIDENPLCKEHDLPFVSGADVVGCPESILDRCDNAMKYKDRRFAYKLAESYIDKKIRNKEY